MVIVLLKVWLSDVELGRFDDSQLGTLVMVLRQGLIERYRTSKVRQPLT